MCTACFRTFRRRKIPASTPTPLTADSSAAVFDVIGGISLHEGETKEGACDNYIYTEKTGWHQTESKPQPLINLKASVDHLAYHRLNRSAPVASPAQTAWDSWHRSNVLPWPYPDPDRVRPYSKGPAPGEASDENSHRGRRGDCRSGLPKADGTERQGWNTLRHGDGPHIPRGRRAISQPQRPGAIENHTPLFSESWRGSSCSGAWWYTCAMRLPGTYIPTTPPRQAAISSHQRKCT